MGFAVRPDLRVESVGAGLMVLVPGQDKVLHLKGRQVEAFALARAGATDVPDHLVTEMAGLVELGVVETTSWSRRQVLRAGGVAAAAGVAVVALPSIAAASSPTTTAGTTSTTSPTTTTAPPEPVDAVWTKLWTAPPPSRSYGNMATGPGGMPVIFGGRSGLTILNDTWVWNGAGWTEQTGTAPPARFGAAMAETGPGQVVLFGGSGEFNGGSNPNAPGSGMGDTWIWNGSSWNQYTPDNPDFSPPARHSASMAMTNTGETLLFGGLPGHTGSPTDDGGPFGDTWLLQSHIWVDLTPVAPEASPPARWGAMMAPGPNGTIVLFGGVSASGVDLGDTWVWSHGTWTDVTPSDPSKSPAARHQAAVAKGPGNTVVINSGASNTQGQLGDTWVWNGSAWHQAASWQAGGAYPNPNPSLVGIMAYGPDDKAIFSEYAVGNSDRSTTWTWGAP